MTKYMFIRRTFQGAYAIHTDDDYDEQIFMGYSKRDALRKYRQNNGLVGKHFILLEQ